MGLWISLETFFLNFQVNVALVGSVKSLNVYVYGVVDSHRRNILKKSVHETLKGLKYFKIPGKPSEKCLENLI